MTFLAGLPDSWHLQPYPAAQLIARVIGEFPCKGVEGDLR